MAWTCPKPDCPRPKPEPVTKTDTELDGMVSHVRYEIVQLTNFLAIGNEWPTKVVGLPPGWGRFASEGMLEAALIHARCVAEFLRRTDQPADTITAKDYLPGGWHWTKGEGLKDDLAEIHGRVAHLGLNRLSVQRSGEDFTWHDFLVGSAVPTLLSGVLEFFDALEPKRRAEFDRLQSGGQHLSLTAQIRDVLHQPGR